MFDQTSRYYNLETKQYTTADGRKIAYVSRRFLPQAKDLPLLVEIIVKEGDRLDLISARTLGTPEQYWQICDANNAVKPVELTSEPGQIIRVPLPRI